MTKEEKAKLKAEKKAKGESLWKDFKAFITRGNVLDLAVGVIMGSAFSAIVTAFTNILLSVCTWGVPGGLSGLVTVLPALNDAQKGVEGIGQSFSNDKLAEMAELYCNKMGGTYKGNEAEWLSSIKSLYTQHGNVWTYNQSAVIDWGTFINAVISFLVIAITLFIIIKTFNTLQAKRKEFEKSLQQMIEKPETEEEVKEETTEAKAE